MRVGCKASTVMWIDSAVSAGKKINNEEKQEQRRRRGGRRGKKDKNRTKWTCTDNKNSTEHKLFVQLNTCTNVWHVFNNLAQCTRTTAQQLKIMDEQHTFHYKLDKWDSHPMTIDKASITINQLPYCTFKCTCIMYYVTQCTAPTLLLYKY